jgi:signal transduction histidine kinase
VSQSSNGVPATRPGEGAPISPAERAMLEGYDAQRRLALLWVMVPGLLIVTLAALPFAINSDVSTGTHTSTLQLGVGLVGFALAFWGVRTKRVNLASYALFAGVSGVIVLLILYDGPLSGALSLSAIPDFALLTLPVVLAGLLTGPWFVVLAMAAAAAFSVATVLMTPHDSSLMTLLQTANGLSVFTVPISLQLAIGVLMLAATRGYRRIQRELGDTRVAYARERELDRLKDQFISSVNHELRTPIMALQGYLAIARELGERGDLKQQAHMLTRGTQATEHLAGIVRSVLDIRRVENDTANLALAPVTLRSVVVQAIDLLDPRSAQGKERDLRLQVPEDLVVMADADRLRQVLLNLLSNAVKYSDPGTPVDVHARCVTRSGARQRNGHAGDTIELTVRDYGLGVPPDQAVLLFQRFVRLERDIASPVMGTGLGLAICRAYIEAMGGRIWLDSSGIPGEGTTVAFALPAARSEPAIPHEAAGRTR